MGDEAEVCANCSHELSPGDKTCSECGHEVQPAPDEARPEKPKNTRKTVILVVVGAAILGLIIALGAWWLSRPKSELSAQYETSAGELMTMLSDMSAVQSTQQVRDTALAAEPQIDAIDAALEEDPQAADAAQLTTLSETFTTLGALTAFSQDDTEVWTKNRQPLIDSLNTLTSYGGPTAQASSTGDGAVQALDDLTARIDVAMTKYRKELEKFKADATGKRYDLDTYYMQMEPLIKAEDELNRKTIMYVDRLRTKEVFMFDVIDYFSTVAADRRDIANQMGGVYAPGDFYDVNYNLVTAATVLADNADTAVSELQDADCTYGTCYFGWKKSWAPILLGSPEIKADYRKAQRAWESAVLSAEEQLTGRPRPQEPNL